MEKKKATAARRPAEKKTNLPPLFILLFYALIELFPRLKAVDVMGSQWLVTALLNAITILYLYREKNFYTRDVLQNITMMLLGGFLLAGAISFTTAFNLVESLVTYSRFLTVAIALLNITVIFRRDPTLLPLAIRIIAVALVLQSLFELFHFLDSLKSRKPLDELIGNLKGNTGNKNFLGAGILLRIPFLLPLLADRRLFLKIAGLAGLMISSTTLIVINSRSTIVALLLTSLLFVAVMFLLGRRTGNKSFYQTAGFYVLSLGLAYLFSQSLFTSASTLAKTGGYGELGKRISSISFTNEGSSGRVRLWTSAIDFIGNHPLLGGGFGNWKINSIPYESQTIRGFGIRKHVHNDYLEVTAETGIPGGLLYAAFLFSVLFYGLRLILKGNLSSDFLFPALALVLSWAAFLSDSLFNFPLERPNIMFHIAFCAGGITALHIRQKGTGTAGSTRLTAVLPTVVILALTAGTVWSAWQCYRSMVAQDKVAIEWFGMPKPADPPFRADEVIASFPAYPNLNELGMPIACMKAKYLAQEGRHTEAKAVLEEGNDANPFLYFAEFLLTNMAIVDKQPDSALHYARLAYYNRPANQQLFDLLYDIAGNQKDTMEMRKAFALKTETRPEESDYTRHAEYLYTINLDMAERKRILEQGEKRFPEGKEVLFQKYFTMGLEYGEQEQHDSAGVCYARALNYKANPQASRNAGISFLKAKRFEEAIPYFNDAISSGKFSDGLPEYGRGACNYNLKRFEAACPDILEAVRRGYPAQGEVLERCRQSN